MDTQLGLQLLMKQYLTPSVIVDWFKTQDTKQVWNAVKVGGCGAGLALGFTYLKQKSMADISPCAELMVETQFIGLDPDLCELLLTLQNYRELSISRFNGAIRNMDMIFGIEYALQTEKDCATQNDVKLALQLYEVIKKRLHLFVNLAQEIHLGREHIMIMSSTIEKIIERIRDHTFRIRDMCQEVDPEQVIKFADRDIKSALKKRQQAQRQSQPEYSNQYQMPPKAPSNDRPNRLGHRGVYVPPSCSPRSQHDVPQV